MPSCCSTFGDIADEFFSQQMAARDLARYQRKGPGPTTRLIVDGITAAGASKGLLLDVGSGVGSLTFELLDRGVTQAIAVDASAAYLGAASEEAARRRRTDALRFVHGDFVTVAPQLPTATVVTLDRVVCCYPHYEPLLQEAANHATEWLALSYPRDIWLARAAMSLENAQRRWKRSPFRTFVHSVAAMEQVVRRSGFDLVSRKRIWMWSIDVLRRR
jgi:magnesium-protoporphyrin O-methyltransferase